VLGSGADAAARLGFYAKVLGLQADRAGIDLGPGGPEALALAQVILRWHGILSADSLRARLPSLRVEAASRARAEGAGPADPSAVEVLARAPSHAGFFALDVVTLRHRRFAGGLSDPLRREVFVSGDAVTVLPYDPMRDRVLLVEQFRAGAFGRGDPRPWQIEAIAGRIDPGETPEAAARREAEEEAGLTLGALLPVAAYYPSPGALTEYIYSFVALCDLPDGSAGVFGAEDEGEDICGHLWPFADLMQALAEGRITNAPLILTAQWLAARKADLTGG
jgi:nudix-type nucleoside diphosphatase (YffH/AdpP family)